MAKGKSKTRRASSRPPDVDPNQRRRERLDARREAKAEALRRQRARQRRDRVVRALTVAGLVAFAAWFFVLRTRAPSSFNRHPVQELSAAGVGQHLAPGEQPPQYDVLPPVSGVHAPGAGECGTFAAAIDEEVQVHKLEHGAVGVQFKPELPPEDIAKIEQIVAEYPSHVFSAPYAQMTSPITVTSWGRRMQLETLDEEAIRQYIEAFRDKGPEPGEACDNTESGHFTYPTPDPSPSPSPSPAQSPSPGGGANDGGQAGDRKGERRGG